MKGKIKFIQQKGNWPNPTGNFNSYQVTFADGQMYKFNAKITSKNTEGKFSKQVGDEIEYEVTNQEFSTAKLVYTQPQSYQAPTQPTYTSNKPKYDTGQSILRQVSFKGVIELISAGKIALSEAEHYTNEFHNLLNK